MTKRIFILPDSITFVGKGWKRWSIGFWRRGNCWRFEFRRDEYATCVFYGCWRFFVARDKKPVRVPFPLHRSN